MENQSFELKNGNIFVLAEAAGGVYSAAQLKKVCEVLDKECAFIKIIENQRIGFILPQSKLVAVQKQVSAFGVLLRPAGSFAPKVCFGELCKKCEQNSLDDSIQLTAFLSQKWKGEGASLSIGINACPVACVSAATDDIYIMGAKAGYKIYIGGRQGTPPSLAQLLLEGVSPQDLSLRVGEIIEIYNQNKAGGETLFHVIERLGLHAFHSEAMQGHRPWPTPLTSRRKIVPEQKVDMRLVGDMFELQLENGAQLNIPYYALQSGRAFELQFENRTCLIVPREGKIHVQYDSMELVLSMELLEQQRYCAA